MHEDSHHNARGGSKVEFRNYTYFRPAILILLKEHDSHGYELVERLAEVGFNARASRESASVYRMLRAMEKQSLTSSSWDISKVGPPRRVYAITADGHRYLDECQLSLVRQRDALDALIHRYETISEPSTPPLRACAQN